MPVNIQRPSSALETVLPPLDLFLRCFKKKFIVVGWNFVHNRHRRRPVEFHPASTSASHLALSRLASRPASPCLALPRPASPCLALPRPASPCLALLRPASPCLALPSPVAFNFFLLKKPFYNITFL
jgi:hypothetical protein